MRNGFLFIVALLLAALGVSWLAGRRSSAEPGERIRDAVSIDRPGERGEDDDVALTSPEDLDEPNRTEEAPAEAPAQPSRPERLSPTVAPAADFPSAAVNDLMGVVVDAAGQPLAGVEVELLATAAQLSAAGLDSTLRIVGKRLVATTDGAGSFLFPGCPARMDSEVLFARNLLVGDPLEHLVDPELTWQVLTLPDPAAPAGTWTIYVVDQHGRPVLGTLEGLIREGAGTGGQSRAFLSHTLGHRFPGERRPQWTVKSGRITITSIHEGNWFASVHADGAVGARVESPKIAPPNDNDPSATMHVETRVSLTVHANAETESALPENHPDGTPYVHEGAPMADWLPEDLLQVGEWDRDRHFARTFRFAIGKPRAAELIMDLEATSGASDNDGVYLESLNGKRFAWSSRVDAITSHRWISGARETVSLDLSSLVAKDGSNASLLDLMQDGMLDVMLQDDTIVHSARLRVIH